MKPMKRLSYVAFFGKKGSGKNYMASELATRLPGIKFITTAFADPVKELVEWLFGVPKQDLWGSSKNRERILVGGSDLELEIFLARANQTLLYTPVLTDLSEILRQILKDLARDRPSNITARHLLRKVSEDIKAGMGEDFWIKKLEQKRALETQKDPNSVLLVTDGRFPLEAKAIKDADGICVKIVNPKPQSDDHVTENSVDLIDESLFSVVIKNDGKKYDVMAFHDLVCNFIESIFPEDK